MDDKSGIYSLGGFAYQIRVFAILLPLLRSGDSLGFEAIDDVSTDMTPDNWGDSDDSILSCHGLTAIQVKKTDVTATLAKKVLKNWIKIKIEHVTVNAFVLYTDRQNTSSTVFSNLDADEIIKEIEETTSTRSIDAQIKSFGKTEEELRTLITAIISNIKVKIYGATDEDIKDNYEEFFARPAVTEFVYVTRINQLLMTITDEIIQAILQGNPYTLEWTHLAVLQNKYIQDITDEHMEPSYSEFRKLRKINLGDIAISGSREYQQLCECDLDEGGIVRHLMYDYYYKDCKMRYFELGKDSLVDDLEVTAHDNFCDTKDELSASNSDSPKNRLNRTKEKSNARAINEQIKYGVCIDLTKAETSDELKISWKDEGDE